MENNLTVVCVCVGTKYPKKYVHILQAMVKKNLTVPHNFICVTDDAKGMNCKTIKAPNNLNGWWSKIYLFKSGLFKNKTLYLDLDIAITRNIDDLVKLDGFHIWADPNVGGFNSSIMLFDPNDDVSKVWTEFDQKWIKKYYGDQDVITMMLPNAKTFPDGWCWSYKRDCIISPPVGAKIVVFHGRPNPHECLKSWVGKYWKI